MISKTLTFALAAIVTGLGGTLRGGIPETPSPVAPSPAQGRLVIVGGALRASNDAVFRALLEGPETPRVGIVPAASGYPSRTARRFRAQLLARGLSPEQIEILPLAVVDDPSTEDLDESSWRSNGEDPVLAKRIEALDVIWLTGGDQSRLAQVLGTPEAPTPVLRALLERYREGGTIGGTSAGAAVMSHAMILGGTSPGALRHGTATDYAGMGDQERGPLVLGVGFGLFPHGLIDQHFDRKARLGRLVVALAEGAAENRMGYGIDEDTALVHDAQRSRAEVIGTGTVSLVDLRKAEVNRGTSWHGIELTVLSPGDVLVWPGPEIVVEADKQPTLDQEYRDFPVAPLTGPLSPYGGRLEDILGFLLLDNAGASVVESRVESLDGTRFRIRFEQGTNSAGFWGSPDGELVRYSVLRVGLSIERVKKD